MFIVGFAIGYIAAVLIIAKFVGFGNKGGEDDEQNE